eukprot:8335388-Pyramimonas_sp.AAC.1
MANPDGGGFRPIAMIACLFRVWARPRQPMAKEWEDRRKSECFREVRGKECDRDSYQRNLLAACATLAGLASATLFADLRKL